MRLDQAIGRVVRLNSHVLHQVKTITEKEKETILNDIYTDVVAKTEILKMIRGASDPTKIKLRNIKDKLYEVIGKETIKAQKKGYCKTIINSHFTKTSELNTAEIPSATKLANQVAINLYLMQYIDPDNNAHKLNTADIEAWRRIREKDDAISQIQKLMKYAAVDCDHNRAINQRTEANTLCFTYPYEFDNASAKKKPGLILNAPLFHPDITHPYNSNQDTHSYMSKKQIKSMANSPKRPRRPLYSVRKASENKKQVLELTTIGNLMDNLPETNAPLVAAFEGEQIEIRRLKDGQIARFPCRVYWYDNTKLETLLEDLQMDNLQIEDSIIFCRNRDTSDSDDNIIPDTELCALHYRFEIKGLPLKMFHWDA